MAGFGYRKGFASELFLTFVARGSGTQFKLRSWDHAAIVDRVERNENGTLEVHYHTGDSVKGSIRMSPHEPVQIFALILA